jgi:hypothetical protein
MKDVLPFLEVEPNTYGRFRAHGDAAGYITWGPSEVKPLVIVEPNAIGNFVPK